MSINTKPASDGGSRQQTHPGQDGTADTKVATTNQYPITAELSGCNVCRVGNHVTTGPTPILSACRELLAQGIDPGSAVEIYRAGILALRVRSIGEGARLEINGKGTGFKCLPAVGTASPVRNSEVAL